MLTVGQLTCSHDSNSLVSERSNYNLYFSFLQTIYFCKLLYVLHLYIFMYILKFQNDAWLLGSQIITPLSWGKGKA